MHAFFTTFFLSMIPISELRAAIPVGVAMGLEPWQAAIIAVIGNMIPAPFIILFIRQILTWLRKKSVKFDRLISKIERGAEKKAQTVLKYEHLGLLIFVAIPLPGTGAWTGSLIASILDMRLKKALPTIFLGLLISATIVTLITMGVIAL